jgi:hypothetical protein
MKVINVHAPSICTRSSKVTLRPTSVGSDQSARHPNLKSTTISSNQNTLLCVPATISMPLRRDLTAINDLVIQRLYSPISIIRCLERRICIVLATPRVPEFQLLPRCDIPESKPPCKFLLQCFGIAPEAVRQISKVDAPELETLKSGIEVLVRCSRICQTTRRRKARRRHCRCVEASWRHGWRPIHLWQLILEP